MADDEGVPKVEGRARRVTLAEIARIAKVSPSTVSNAYNRPDQLSASLRARIIQTARELDYSGPHPAARSLRRGVAEAIGVVLTERLSYAFSDAPAIQFLRGLSVTTEAAGLSLLLMPASPRHDAAAIRDAIVDGFVVYSMPDDHPDVAAILERRLPTVFVDSPHIPGSNFVGIDDRAAARQAAEYLLSLGHRRISIAGFALHSDGVRGVASADRKDSANRFVTRQRIAGYRDAIDKRGLSWANVTFYECRSSEQSEGLQAGLTLLHEEPRPTAIIAMSDEIAIGVLEAATRFGIAVPADLSIIGFDDTPRAAASMPPLTTVSQPLTDKGTLAGELLFASMESPESARVAQERILPTSLIVRDSVDGPSSGA